MKPDRCIYHSFGMLVMLKLTDIKRVVTSLTQIIIAAAAIMSMRAVHLAHLLHHTWKTARIW